MAENFDNLFYLPSSEPSSLPESSTVSDDSIISDAVSNTETQEYKPMSYHWFYSQLEADKLSKSWFPMSYKDSTTIEKLFADNKKEILELRKENLSNDKFIISIKGGRFEVDLVALERRPVYWQNKKKSEVRRCLWFYKENDELKFQPYLEEYSEFLEVGIFDY
ncbi:unnamed protein product [Brachionus calyciflorus]|uniref:WWE domain-containing protein n=1 Tax=Brachionus calyciflorus TaxID=104777 RepID=A0A813M2L1_9BILA|nr:unnamed protein product [Brachionus calyciflorus]